MSLAGIHIGKGIRYIFYLLSFCLVFSFNAQSQTQFWIENWTGTACVQGCTTYTGPNGAWTIDLSLGANGANANIWYFSQQEAAMGRTKCGTVNGTVTAHIGNVSTSPLAGIFCPTGDCGAAYDAGDCDGTVIAHTRLESPAINCVGKSTITLSFNYIMNGDATDLCTPYYFDGVSWTTLTAFTRKTCLSGQGKWQYYSVALPASANNNPNVQIGFYWVNDDDCLDFSDDDPSFAVDSIRLLYSAVLPIELEGFNAAYDKNLEVVNLYWSTSTETNNALFTVERTVDGETYMPVAAVKGAGNSLETKTYSAIDPSPYEGTSYYRIKQTDFDEHSTYSYIVAVYAVNANKLKLFPNPASSSVNLSYYSSVPGSLNSIYIYDNAGREIVSYNSTSSYVGENTYNFDVSGLASGMYLIKLQTSTGESNFGKFIKQ